MKHIASLPEYLGALVMVPCRFVGVAGKCHSSWERWYMVLQVNRGQLVKVDWPRTYLLPELKLMAERQ